MVIVCIGDDVIVVFEFFVWMKWEYWLWDVLIMVFFDYFVCDMVLACGRLGLVNVFLV